VRSISCAKLSTNKRALQQKILGVYLTKLKTTLMTLNFKHLKGDLFGGITAGIVALPLALAFGVQSGMGAIAGLYGAIILGVFAAVFGGTDTQVSGPTGPMTVISAMVVASAIEASGSLQAGMGIIIASFFLAGGFQILFGLLKIGEYIKFIPYPVLSGFMTGIGVIIILFQIYPFMGAIICIKLGNHIIRCSDDSNHLSIT
jgi:SulP family sulfate permease